MAEATIDDLAGMVEQLSVSCVIELARRYKLFEEHTIPWPPRAGKTELRSADPLLARLWAYAEKHESGSMGPLRLLARLAYACGPECSFTRIVAWAFVNLPTEDWGALAREVRADLAPAQLDILSGFVEDSEENPE